MNFGQLRKMVREMRAEGIGDEAEIFLAPLPSSARLATKRLTTMAYDTEGGAKYNSSYTKLETPGIVYMEFR